MLEGHPRIRGVQTTGMLVIEAATRPNEHFVQGPLMLIFHTDSEWSFGPARSFDPP
jgi:hypothetical protein